MISSKVFILIYKNNNLVNIVKELLINFLQIDNKLKQI